MSCSSSRLILLILLVFSHLDTVSSILTVHNPANALLPDLERAGVGTGALRHLSMLSRLSFSRLNDATIFDFKITALPACGTIEKL